MWYLQGMFDDEKKTVQVLYYGRFPNDTGAKHPVIDIGTRIDFDETEGRIATTVRFREATYTITNPAYIFSYRDEAQIKWKIW